MHTYSAHKKENKIKENAKQRKKAIYINGQFTYASCYFCRKISSFWTIRVVVAQKATMHMFSTRIDEQIVLLKTIHLLVNYDT